MSTTEPPTSVQVDWAARTVTGGSDADVTVEHCEGEAPFLCFTGRDGEHLGAVELLHFSTVGFEEVTSVGADPASALEAVADDFVASMAADRAEGCGAGYQVVPDERAPVQVAGEDGLRFGFRGIADETTVEHVVIHATIVGDTIWMLTAAGYDEGGCLPRENEFDVAGLASAAPLIGEIAAQSTLPAP